MTWLKAIESLDVTTKARDKKVSMGNREIELKLKRGMEGGGNPRESSEGRLKVWWCPERCWAPN
jgi:hypothetical protein